MERPYVALGSTIQLTLDRPAPDSAVLTNYIINSEGRAKYSLDPSHSAETLIFTDGVASVVLKEDLLAMASSLMSLARNDWLPASSAPAHSFSYNTS